MSGYAWDKDHRVAYLSPLLYPPLQAYVGNGGHIPYDHPVWLQTVDLGRELAQALQGLDDLDDLDDLQDEEPT